MAGDESGTTLGQPHLARQDLSTLVSLLFSTFTAFPTYFGNPGVVQLVERRAGKAGIVEVNYGRSSAASTRHMTAGPAASRASVSRSFLNGNLYIWMFFWSLGTSFFLTLLCLSVAVKVEGYYLSWLVALGQGSPHITFPEEIPRQNMRLWRRKFKPRFQPIVLMSS